MVAPQNTNQMFPHNWPSQQQGQHPGQPHPQQQAQYGNPNLHYQNQQSQHHPALGYFQPTQNLLHHEQQQQQQQQQLLQSRGHPHQQFFQEPTEQPYYQQHQQQYFGQASSLQNTIQHQPRIHQEFGAQPHREQLQQPTTMHIQHHRDNSSPTRYGGAAHKQTFPVGTKVRKFFPAVTGWFEGEVVGFDTRKDPSQPLYQVLYTDGDQEDLEECEVKQGVFDFENQNVTLQQPNNDQDMLDTGASIEETFPFPIGTKIRKYFPSTEEAAADWFEGEVVSINTTKDPNQPLYHVLYSDGDEEDLDEGEVKQGVLDLEQLEQARLAANDSGGRAPTQTYPVGTKIRKYFHATEQTPADWFEGEVVGYDTTKDPNQPLYQVLYLDGDQEDLNEGEVKQGVLDFQSQLPPPQQGQSQLDNCGGRENEVAPKQAFPVGTQIRKYFHSMELDDGSRTPADWFVGEVIGFDAETDPDQPIYQVLYSDGDKEELYEREIKQGVFDFESQTVEPPPQKQNDEDVEMIEEERVERASLASAFTEPIELILKNQAAREEEGGGITQGLTSKELHELSLLCSQQDRAPKHLPPPSDDGVAAPKVESFAGVEGDLLITLVPLLQKHVQDAELQFFDEAAKAYLNEDKSDKSVDSLQQWIRDEARNRLRALKNGLEAANILLQISTTEGVDRRAVNEDAISAAITLFRLHMRTHVIPMLNESAHSTFLSSKDVSVPPPAKKRRRSSAAAATQPTGNAIFNRELGRLYAAVGTTLPLYITMMERLEALLKSNILEDHQVLLITTAAIQAFEIDCLVGQSRGANASDGHQIQLHSIDIVSAAFVKHHSQRETILEELFPIIRQLPTAKRSLRSFRVRYTSASSSSLAQVNRDILRSFLDVGENHSIQMVTALLLSLIQACVVRPLYGVREDQETGQPEYISGLAECQRLSRMVVNEILKRCRKSKFGGDQEEFRTFIANFVQDLLSVLVVPEYPAAEMLLFALMGCLRRDIEQASRTGPGKGPNVENKDSTFLTLAFDLVGKVCTVEARLLQIQKDRPIEVHKGKQASNENAEVSCYCGRQDLDDLCIGCDDCHLIYHGRCVGIPTREAAPKEWICDACRLGRIRNREQRIKKCKNNDSIIDTNFILHHAFLSDVAHRRGEGIEGAVRFHFASWLDQLHAKTVKQPNNVRSQRLFSDLASQFDSIEPNGETLTDEGYNRMILTLFSESSPLALSFRSQISFVLDMMKNMRNTNIRKLALKALEKAAKGDSTLMTMKVVTRSVSSRLSDSAISVRDAALSFVGEYVVKFPKVAAVFQSSLVACLADEGPTVRRRAIKIFQEVLKNQPHYKGRSAACEALLVLTSNPKEKDIVRNAVESLFAELWLTGGDEIVAGPAPSQRKAPPSQTETKETSGSVVTPTPPPLGITGYRVRYTRVELAAEQMMEVVRNAGTSDPLEKFFQKMYGKKENDGRNYKDHRLKHDHLELIVKALFEMLTRLEETRGSRENVGKDIAATLRTIEVLSGAAPEAVLQQIETVVPYLKADNDVSKDDESLIVAACCDIISRTSTEFDRNMVLSFASMSKDLRTIIYNHGPDAISSAVRTLSTLAHHPMADDGEEPRGDFPPKKDLLGLAKTFFSYLLKHKDTLDFSKVKGNIRANNHRAMAVLGFIAKYRGRNLGISSTSREDLLSEGAAAASDLNWSNLGVSCYKLLSVFLEKKDLPTKCVALRALGNVFLSEPRLLFALEEVGLVDDIMSDKAPHALRLEALNVWKRIMETEEKRIDAGEADEKMDQNKEITVSKRISGDQDGDANLFGGILTGHAKSVFEMVSHRDHQLRFSALELLGLLLRQGLVNPNDAVPHLFALQGDIEHGEIRALALDLLYFEGEKRPDMIKQRVRDGVKQAYLFQRTLCPHRIEFSSLIETQHGVECVFSKLFEKCVASVRKQREGLFTSLLGLFDVKEAGSTSRPRSRRSSTSQPRGVSTDLGLLTFVAQILAHLPYAAASDPLFIIHKISSIVAMHGYQILETFSKLIRPLRLNNEDDWDDTNEDEDPLEIAAKTKFPSRSKVAEKLTDGSYDLKPLFKNCQKSGGLVLLLRLKKYLREIYKLTEIRCLEFNPKAKDKALDNKIYRVEDPPKFESKLAVTNVSPTTANPQIDPDPLIRQYAQFRVALREEAEFNATAENARMDKEEKQKPGAAAVVAAEEVAAPEAEDGFDVEM